MALTFEPNDAALAAFDSNGLVSGLVALEFRARGALRPDEALLAAKDEYRSVHQIEIILGSVGVTAVRGISVSVEMPRTFRSEELSVVGAEGDRAVLRLPGQIEKSVRGALVIGRLNTTAGLEAPVTILHRSHVPPLRHAIELELEGLVTRDLVLVCCHIDTWNIIFKTIIILFGKLINW